MIIFIIDVCFSIIISCMRNKSKNFCIQYLSNACHALTFNLSLSLSLPPFSSDLQHLCIEYRLSLRDCKDCIKIDSSQRVPFSEVMRYIRDYAYRKSGPTPPNMHPIHNSYSPVYRHPYFEGSYTPEYSSEDPYRGGDVSQLV